MACKNFQLTEDGLHGRIGRCVTILVAQVYRLEPAAVRTLSQNTVDIHVMEKKRNLLPAPKIKIFQNAKIRACWIVAKVHNMQKKWMGYVHIEMYFLETKYIPILLILLIVDYQIYPGSNNLWHKNEFHDSDVPNCCFKPMWITDSNGTDVATCMLIGGYKEN